jgi:uncharacterized membrane protein YcaP (DUF421 family)
MIELDPNAIGQVIVRTVIVYFALLIGLRVAGKRELGQMAPFDLVVILVISNAVQNAMVGSDTSLTAGLVAALTLLVVNWGVSQLGLRSRRLGGQIIGTPSLLVNDGHFIDDHLRKEGITTDEVMQALREHGVARIEDVELAVLEVDGSISVVPRSPGTKRTRHRFRGRKPID